MPVIANPARHHTAQQCLWRGGCSAPAMAATGRAPSTLQAGPLCLRARRDTMQALRVTDPWMRQHLNLMRNFSACVASIDPVLHVMHALSKCKLPHPPRTGSEHQPRALQAAPLTDTLAPSPACLEFMYPGSLLWASSPFGIQASRVSNIWIPDQGSPGFKSPAPGTFSLPRNDSENDSPCQPCPTHHGCEECRPVGCVSRASAQ